MIKPKVDKFRGRRPKTIRKAIAKAENNTTTSDDDYGDGLGDNISNFIKKALSLAGPAVNTISKVSSAISPGIQSGINTYNNAINAKTSSIKKQIAEEKLKQEKINSSVAEENFKKYQEMLSDREQASENTSADDWYPVFKQKTENVKKSGKGFSIIK